MTGAQSNPQAVQDYIAGRLTDAELRAFEDRLLGDAVLIRDVEETLRLREGLEILRDRNDIAVSVPVHRHPSVPNRLITNRRAATAMAALVLIVFCVGIYYAKRSPPVVAANVAALHVGATLKVVEHYSFAVMRAMNETPDLRLPASGAVEFRALAPGVSTSRRFRATLEKTSNSQPVRIGAADHLAPDADGFVALYADASKLEPGTYVLAVQTGTDDQAPAQQFSFKLHRPTEPKP